MTSYTIPTHRLPEITTYVEKLNGRASKIGCSPIIVSILEEVTHTDPVTSKVYKYSTIEIQGEAPRVNGWAFQSRIDHLTDGNIIKSIPGIELPEQYRTADSICDHCHHDRNRKSTFVLRNDAGEYKQVGSTCLADFLGYRDPKQFAELVEAMGWIIQTAESMEKDDYFSGGRAKEIYNTKRYLSFVAIAIRLDGWTSKKSADEHERISTSSLAFDYMSPSTLEQTKQSALRQPEQQDQDMAQASIDWAKELEGKNDYEYNLSVIARQEYIEPKFFGIAASMIAAYKKHIGQEIERQHVRDTSQHFGTIGKREIFTLTVINIQELDGNYGVTYLHTMKDAAGNIAKWFSSAGCLEMNAPLTIKATVKKHDEYKGIKQTLLSRCSIVEPKKGKE